MLLKQIARWTLGVLGLVLSATALSQTAVPPRISAQEFGELPFISGPRLSPSGNRVLTPTVLRSTRRLIIIDLANRSAITHSFVIPDTYDLVWYRWANEDRILLSVGTTQLFYGEEVFSTRLIVHDLSTGRTSFVGKKNEGIDGDDVIHVAPDGKSTDRLMPSDSSSARSA